MSEFGVHGRESSGDHSTIIGRCYRGPLRLGDVFRTASASGGETVAVELVVERIEAYQRELDEIDEGLTAKLRVIGSGGESVTEGCILST